MFIVFPVFYLNFLFFYHVYFSHTLRARGQSHGLTVSCRKSINKTLSGVVI